jgi:hypothetical protein
MVVRNPGFITDSPFPLKLPLEKSKAPYSNTCPLILEVQPAPSEFFIFAATYCPLQIMAETPAVVDMVADVFAVLRPRVIELIDVKVETALVSAEEYKGDVSRSQRPPA